MLFRSCKNDNRYAGYTLARKMISEYLSVPESDIVFSVDKNGKPYAVGLDVHFNISHSDGIAVCAVNDTPVGIDIEKIRDIDLKIVNRVCTAEQAEYIGDSVYKFFEVWTAKEAYVKCTGEGLKNLKADISNGNFKKIDIADGYVCTVCIK